MENIEKKLDETGRAEVYGIYFDFGSATIRPESTSVLGEIAGLLQKNRGWSLSIEGHTDNIGGDAYNQDLSSRRVAAVRTALVQKYGVAGQRLTTAGYGASRPKESNETLAGRGTAAWSSFAADARRRSSSPCPRLSCATLPAARHMPLRSALAPCGAGPTRKLQRLVTVLLAFLKETLR